MAPTTPEQTKSTTLQLRLLAAIIAAILIAPLASTPVSAGDDDLTYRERSKLHHALRKIGCYSNDFEREDDGTYEVEDARCDDGREYELRFSRRFKLIGGELD